MGPVLLVWFWTVAVLGSLIGSLILERDLARLGTGTMSGSRSVAASCGVTSNVAEVGGTAFDGLGSDLARCWLTLGLVATRGGASASEVDNSVPVFVGLRGAMSSSDILGAAAF